MDFDHAYYLRHYKKDFIQKEICNLCKDREVAVKYGDKGFGKRPEVIRYPSEVFEFAKQGVTSFHVSEERWFDPLNLKTGMSKKELDSLRKGWDLIIDIDSKNWELSKSASYLVIKSLKEIGINNVTAKFSGNKGFHIAVPFESFPKEIDSKNTKDLFPEIPKKIASYLIDYINDNYILINSDEKIILGDKIIFSVSELKQIVKDEKKDEELVEYICRFCGDKKKEKEEYYEYICPSCGKYLIEKNLSEDYKYCPSCLLLKLKKLMNRQIIKNKLCSCGKEDFKARFNIASVVQIDTLLISSRHMFRCIYSLHEKSGRASVPINLDNIENILVFNKKDAEPDNIVEEKNYYFLDKRDVKNEGYNLFMKLYEPKEKHVVWITKEEVDSVKKDISNESEFEIISEAVPEELFPPCIKRILNGIDDGKKRALFILTNFLFNVGWDKEGITNLLKDWNKKNKDPISETMLLGHIRYHSFKKDKVLPPNCTNEGYYKDLQFCVPDSFCKNIKNPLNYTRKKIYIERISEKNKPKKNDSNNKKKDK
jgi:predicted RNA-binding Zn-ribbon protein involved in translation (DUF1610 family)